MNSYVHSKEQNDLVYSNHSALIRPSTSTLKKEAEIKEIQIYADTIMYVVTVLAIAIVVSSGFNLLGKIAGNKKMIREI